jgi:hypothetical protein
MALNRILVEWDKFDNYALPLDETGGITHKPVQNGNRSVLIIGVSKFMVTWSVNKPQDCRQTNQLPQPGRRGNR